MLDANEYARLLHPLLERAAGYARSILRDRHDAEDAVQQAAMRAFERRDTYDTARPFKGWWFAILRNCCMDRLRSAKANKTENLDDHDVAADAQEVFDWEQLSGALERLSSEHREILRLRYFADLSYKELAEALSIPQGTVMSRLHLARAALAAKTREVFV